MDYKAVYTENYFSGKNSFFYRMGYGRFAASYFNDLFNPLRSYIRNIKKGRVLDIGCAYGFMLEKFPDSFEKFGMDISAHAIKEAASRLPNAMLKIGEAEKEFPFQKDFFDVVTCNDVLEHLEHPEKALEHMYGALKKGGILYINTPNLNRMRRVVFRYADAKEHHISLFGHRALLDALTGTGFIVLDHWTWVNIAPVFSLALRSLMFRSNLGTESAFICRK